MTQPNTSNSLKDLAGIGLYRTLQNGAKIRLTNGAVAEVTGNPGDGAWLLVRFVEYPTDPSQVGLEEMVFFTDVESLV